jgi:hypothetical protein
MRELVALHKHWCTADAVKLSVAAPVHDGLPNWPEELLALATLHSQFLRLSVWYALLYVVVEGYRELKANDPAVNQLLANEAMADTLRRFRNAVFHFQEDPVGPKLMEFLQAQDSERWAHQLHAAFKAFFEAALPLEEIAQSLGTGGGA